MRIIENERSAKAKILSVVFQKTFIKSTFTMKSDSKFIRESDESDDDDEIQMSDNEASMSESSDDMSTSDAIEDGETNNDNATEQNELGPSSSSRANNQDDEEEDEDEVVKAILKSKELHREHPPNILVDDVLADICFHPKEDLIALASITGDVLLYKYNNEDNELKSTIELHEKACRDIEFSEDGNVLFSTGKDKTVILSDVETEKLIRIYDEAHADPIYSLTVIDENLFSTGDDEGTVRLWDRRQRGVVPIFSLKEMDDFVSAMITNDDKKYLVCASGDGTLTTLSIGGKKLHVRTEDYPQELTCLGLFKHGRKILAGGSKGNLFLFNWGEFGLHSDEIPSLTKKSINCMVPITETIVITGGEDKLLRATSLFPNRQLGIVGQHDLSVECLDICNDGTIIASYSYDNTVKFWNISYFETLNISQPIKGGKQKQVKHNLPSSKLDNASDFFADL